MSKQNSWSHPLYAEIGGSLLQVAAALPNIRLAVQATTARAQKRGAGSAELAVLSYGDGSAEGARRNIFGSVLDQIQMCWLAWWA